ncbi:MAG TPA: GNAT family N-acetyltransferase [Gaiellaceae bacterium]|nr:GNAT family N-acetyltransferase [Gaiellaceae bacterium]
MKLVPPSPPLDDGVVRLRPWEPTDVEAVVMACTDDETARWTMVPVPYTREHARSWIDSSTRAWADGQAAFAVTVDGAVVGAMTLWVLPHETAEIGYWALPAFRARGYTTRALRLVCEWALGELALARVQLGTYPGNAASERVAEKAGFAREGVLRSWHAQRGERRDVTMWSLLPGELR